MQHVPPKVRLYIAIVYCLMSLICGSVLQVKGANLLEMVLLMVDGARATGCKSWRSVKFQGVK